MLIAENKIDDFKTDRKDVAPALPMVMRLVPILFYLSLLFLVVVGSFASLRAKFASDQRNAVTARIESLKGEIEGVKGERTALEKEIIEAQDMEAWVLASMPLQPLVVDITESMGPQSEIVELSIERDAETPSQLRLNLKLNTASDKQLDQTLAVIQKRNYREFNPTQTRVQGNLDYKASLLWDPNAEQRQTPEERKESVTTLP
jgi:hypothetical protein